MEKVASSNFQGFLIFFTEIPRFVFLRLADLWRTRYVYNVKPISLSSTKKRFQRNLIVNNLQSQIYRFKKIMVENINNTCCKWNIELFVIIELSLREKCPNTEIFLVRIFPHSDWIWRDAKYLSLFSPNAGKYGPEKLRIWTFSRSVFWRLKRLPQKLHPADILIIYGCFRFFSNSKNNKDFCGFEFTLVNLTF